jgi:oxygen-independent coproporphyrinogen-3 oxidase
MRPELGVYLHFPWCRQLCPYCDFAVMVARGEPPHEAYRDAVLAELAERAADWQGRELVTIYLGGGTPSLWRPDCIADVIAGVRTALGASAPPREVTIEANPTDCTPARLAAWRAAGIDRVSIGVQSLDAAELATLGRDHALGDGPTAIAAALAAGLRSVSADLILGTPVLREPARVLPSAGGSAESERGCAAGDGAPDSVHALATSGAPHLSVYELTIEARTQFGKRARQGTLVTLPDERLAALYEATHHALAAAGFEHYEISSYARPGHRAVHNSLYWRGVEYLGLGAGAASFHLAGGGARRATNVRHARVYLGATGAARVAEVLELDAEDVAIDRVWLAMRTSDGARAEDLDALGGPARARLLDRLGDEGLAALDGDRLRPTLRGFLFNDRIARHVVHARIEGTR